MRPYQKLDYYIRNFDNLKSVDVLAHYYVPIGKIPSNYSGDSYFNSPNYSYLNSRLYEKNTYKKALLESFSENNGYFGRY